MTQGNEAPQTKPRWEPPSADEIARTAKVTAADIADAIRHIQDKHPELAAKWGLDRERSKRFPKRKR
jgi:hypothetical protein